MLRDIDYAATAVKTAIIEKFGRQFELQDLTVTADDTAISIHHQGRSAKGTRHALLAAVRDAQDFNQLWQVLQPAKTSD
ncbi:MAG: hypothetical protein WD894_09900 [Pirellulales bacterium]